MERINFQLREEYIGLSADVASLPTKDIISGSTFLAVDTGKYYIFYAPTATWYLM